MKDQSAAEGKAFLGWRNVGRDAVELRYSVESDLFSTTVFHVPSGMLPTGSWSVEDGQHEARVEETYLAEIHDSIWAVELAAAIENTLFSKPICPIYQNVTANAVHDEASIKTNLISQLTAPVRWTQSVQQMISDGATLFTEVGPGNVLQGLVKKINREAQTVSASL
jgi:hypothetical protein